MIKRRRRALVAALIAAGVVVLVLAGVEAQTLLFLAFVLACPLMMVFMMHGMHGGHGGHALGSDAASHVEEDADAVLARRFAAGEIDADEYRRRLATLHTTADERIGNRHR